MKSKTSFINTGILRNDFKSLGWIGGGYLLGLLLSVPLQLIMLYSRAQQNPDIYYRPYSDSYAFLGIFQFNSALQVMLLVLVPILAGIWLFRYLQDDKAADMIHALPVRREILYNTHVLSGLIFLFVPLIITALVSWALVAGLGLPHVSFIKILIWLSVSMLLNLLFFLTSVFTGTFTGMSTVQGILSFILLLLPTGLSMLLLHNMKMYTYGFADGYYNMGINVSPLIRITEFSGKPILPSEVAIYLLVSVALLLLGRYLYQKRPLETAGNAITLGVLRPILKYCVTFCFMLLLGSSFYSSQGSSMGWAYFGYFLGSVLAYFLMEILLKKSLRVFDLPVIKGYGIYGLVVLVLIGAFHIDISGYEKRLPVLSEVESVFWDSSFYSLNKPQMVTTAQPATSYNYEFARPVPIYRDKDNIAAIYALHEKIISLKAQEEAARLSNNINTPRQTVCLVYHLKNGSRICRQYTITTDNYHDQLKPVSESREYKSLNYPIMRINPAMVKVISINGAESNKRVSLTDPAVVLQAVTALQKDVLSLSYEQMNRNLPPWAGINILLDNKKTFDMSWEKSFGHFEEFLKTIGQYKQARIIPGEDVEYALVEKAPPDKTGLEAMEAQGKYAPSRTDSYYMRELEAKPGVLKISDPSQLETCLRTYGYSERQTYNIYFVRHDGNAFCGGYNQDKAPEFIKEYFTGAR